MENKHKINKKCPRCGGTNAIISVDRETGIKSKVCQDCGKWSPVRNLWYYIVLTFVILLGVPMLFYGLLGLIFGV